jgi:hypothetical protein
MRKYVLDDYIKANKADFTRSRLRADRKRTPCSRPRDAEELDIMIELDRERWNRWIADGRLVVLGNRRYRLSLFP